MKPVIFGVVTGMCLAIAGTDIVHDPLKTIALITLICLAHTLTQRNS